MIHPADLDVDSLRRSLRGRVVGSRLGYYDTLGSTMDEARRLGGEGAPEGVVVIAEEQTAGRGRFDRAWISPRGQNLSFSLLLRPTPEQLPFVNMAAALAVCRAVGDVAGLASTIKWPNDVRVNGRKISGILVETDMRADELVHAVVGVGVNVNLDPSRHPEIASLATSIRGEIGREADRTAVLQTVLEHLDDLYRAVKAGRSLTDEWSAKLDTLGHIVRVRWQDQVVDGRADAVDEHGNLVLARPDGSTFTAVAGEVTTQV